MEDSRTTVSEGEWSSLVGLYTSEEADFMAELLGSYFPSNVEAEAMRFTCSYLEPATTVASGDDYGSYYNSYFRYSQSPGHGDYNLSYSSHVVVTNIHGSSSSNVSSDVNYLTEEGAELKGGFDVSEQERDDGGNKHGDGSVGKSKKRTRSGGHVTKTKRNVKSKKNPSSQDEDEVNASGNDDSATSKDQHTGSTSSSKDPTALNPGVGKARAGRGSATDPQSLYARKRRERINERLRILQNIIPNGTKVDISTMLEEAVQYVKFLQLQIKLLSSDDLWMYAPVAYNGMDIELDAASLVRARNNESRLGRSTSEI